MATNKQKLIRRDGVSLKTPWLDNAMKSIGATTNSVFSQLYPNLMDVTGAGLKTTKTLITTIRQGKANTNRVTATLKQNKYVQASSQALKNALKDFKSGNIAGHEESFDDFFGGMSDNSDVTFGEDDVGSESAGGESYNINVDDGTRDAVLRLQDSFDKQAKTTVELNKANMDAQLSINAMQMQQISSLTAEITGHLSNISNSLESIAKFNTENMQKFIDSSVAYYEAMGAKSEGGATILNSEELDAISMMRDSRGGINMNQYKELVKKQAKKALDDVPLLGEIIGQVDDSFLEMFAKNPLGTVSSMIGPAIVTKLMGNTLTGVETAMQNFLPTMLDRIAAIGEEEAEGFSGAIKKYLAQTFGVKIDTKNSLSVTRMENRPVPFDNETKTAITEIITKELREQTEYLRIIAEKHNKKATQGAKENSEMFDYSTMKYIKVKDKRRTTADELMGEIMKPLTSDSKFFQTFTQAVKGSTNNKGDQNALIQAAQQLLKAMSESGPGLNIHDTSNKQYSDAIEKAKKTAGNKNIKTVVDAFSKIAEENPAIADQLTAQLLSSRKNKNNVIKQMMADPTRYGLIATGDNEIEDVDEWLRQNSTLFNTAMKSSIRSSTKKRLGNADFSPTPNGNANTGFIGDLFKNGADSVTNTLNGIMSGRVNFDNIGGEFGKIFKDGAKDIGESLKLNIFNPLKESILGIKDDSTGKYNNGLLSSIRNSLSDTFSHIKYTLTGHEYTDSNGTTYSENNDSIFGTVKRGILSKLLGPEELDENGNPTGKRSGGLFSKIKDAFNSGLKGWQERFIGEPLDDKSEEEIQKKMTEKLNGYTKNATVGGAIGVGVGMFAGSSLLGTLVGGPIGGVGLGIAAGILSKNERIQNWLFGEKDENGERTGGFISKGVQDYVKKHKLDIAGGAAIGGLTSALTGKGIGILGTFIGGPLVGAGLGVATTLVARSERFKNFLFGNEETAQKGLIPGIRDAFKKGTSKFTGEMGVNLSADSKVLGMSGLGILGGVMASAILPGGPIFGGLLGLGASIAANGKTFSKYLFGEDYVDEATGEKKHKHGLFGRVGNMINANFLRPMKTQLSYWAKQSLLDLEYTVGDSISFLAEGIAEKVGDVVGTVKAKFDDVVNNISGFLKENILNPFAEILNNTIVTPIKKVVSGAATIVYEFNRHLVLAPFRIIQKAQSFIYNKVAEAWRNSPLNAALDAGKDWLKTTVKNEIKWVGRRIVGLTKLALSPFRLAMKGIGTALTVATHGAKKGVSWIARSKLGQAIGFSASEHNGPYDTENMSRAERWRARRARSKEERQKLRDEYKAQKIRDKNAKIIQKYTKGQYSSDTAEARYMAKVMSGGKAAKLLDTSVETEDAITRRAREQTNGVSLIGKGFKDIDKIPFSKLSENAQITFVLKKIYDQITGNRDSSDENAPKSEKELERFYGSVTASERENGYKELSEIIKNHTDENGNIDYDAVEADVVNSSSENTAGLQYALSATKVKLAQAGAKKESIRNAATNRRFGDEVDMHGGVKGYLRHKFNEGILNITSGAEKDVYDSRSSKARSEVISKLRKLLSKHIIYLNPGESIPKIADRVLETGVLRNINGDKIDLDGNLINDNDDSSMGLSAEYKKYSKGPVAESDDAKFGASFEDSTRYNNSSESNLIMRLRNRIKRSEVRLRNKGRSNMIANGGEGGGRGDESAAVVGATDTQKSPIVVNNISTPIKATGDMGQRRADRILNAERNEQRSIFTAIRENTKTIKEKASSHFENWKSVFGKTGKIAKALLLASPFIVKAFKWLASSPLGKLVSNVVTNLKNGNSEENKDLSTSEKIASLFVDENGESIFKSWNDTRKKIKEKGFFNWADEGLEHSSIGEVYKGAKSIIKAYGTIAVSVGQGIIKLVEKVDWPTFTKAVVKIGDQLGNVINTLSRWISGDDEVTDNGSKLDETVKEAKNTVSAVKEVIPGTDNYDPVQAPFDYVTNEKGEWDSHSQAKANFLLHPGAKRAAGSATGLLLKGGSHIAPIGTKILTKKTGEAISKGGAHTLTDVFNPVHASGAYTVGQGLHKVADWSARHSYKAAEKTLVKKKAAEATLNVAEDKLSKAIATKAPDKVVARAEKSAFKASEKLAKYEKTLVKQAARLEDNVAAAAASEKGLKGIIGKIVDSIKKFVSKIKDLVIKKGAKGTTKSIDEAEKVIIQAAEKFGPKEATKVEVAATEATAKSAGGAATLGIGTVIMEGGGFLIGLAARGGKAGAAKLFQIDQDSVTTGMEVIAAIFGGFAGTTLGSIIDIIFEIINTLTGWNGWHNLANAAYNLFAGDKDVDKLMDAQKLFKDEYKEYVADETQKAMEKAIKDGQISPDMTVDEFKEWAALNNVAIKHKSFDDWNMEKNTTLGDKVGKHLSKAGKFIRGVTDEAVELVGDTSKKIWQGAKNSPLGGIVKVGSSMIEAFNPNSNLSFKERAANVLDPLGLMHSNKKYKIYKLTDGSDYYYKEDKEDEWYLYNADGVKLDEIPPLTFAELMEKYKAKEIEPSEKQEQGFIGKSISTVKSWFGWGRDDKKKTTDDGKNKKSIKASIGSAITSKISNSKLISGVKTKFNNWIAKYKTNDTEIWKDPTDDSYYTDLGSDTMYKHYSASGDLLNEEATPERRDELLEMMKRGELVKEVKPGKFDVKMLMDAGKNKVKSLWQDMFNKKDSALYKVREAATAVIGAINPIAGVGLGILKLSNQYCWSDPNSGEYYVPYGKTYKHYTAAGDEIPDEGENKVDPEDVKSRIKLGLLVKKKIPLKHAAQAALKNFTDKTKEMWDKTTKTVGKFFNKMNDFTTGVFTKIKDKFPSVGKIVESIEETINGVINKIKNTASSIWDGITSGLKDFGSDVASLFGGGSGSGKKNQNKNMNHGGKGPDEINGMPYYSQSDEAWSSNKYGNDGATMDDTGCGPTAMSMVASKMTGRNVLPTETASLAEMTGDRDETGTNWNFIDKAADTYGIETNEEYAPSTEFIASELSQGKPMILSGASGDGRSRGGRGDTPYTDAGHYVVATGIDSSGNVDISDPRGKSYSKKYKLDDIVNQTGKAWSFGQGGGYGRDTDNYGGRGPQGKSTPYWNRTKSSTPNKSNGTKLSGKYNGRLERDSNGGYNYINGDFTRSWSASTPRKNIDVEIDWLDRLITKLEKNKTPDGQYKYKNSKYNIDKTYDKSKSLNDVVADIETRKNSKRFDEKYLTRDSNGNYIYNDGYLDISFPNSMTKNDVLNALNEKGVNVSRTSSGKTKEEIHREHIEFLKNHVDTRLADFSKEVYTAGDGGLPIGQCTWYAESRAFERGGWKGRYDQPMGNGNMVYENAKSKGYETGTEIADDALLSIDTGSSAGHVVYVEGYDEETDNVYWTEGNGDGMAAGTWRDRYNNGIPPDGYLRVTPKKDFPLYGGKALGYVYVTDADTYDGETTSSSSSSSNGTDSNSSTSSSSSSSSSSNNSKDSKPTILDFISQVFSRVGSTLINGMFTGNFDIDFSDIISGINGNNSSSGTTNTTTNISGNSSSSSSNSSSYSASGEDNRADSMISGAKGVDISYCQTGCNYENAKSDGIEFAMIKIGEGGTIVDNMFETHFNGCVKAGIHTGGYYYCRANNESEAIQEANHCLSIIKGKKFDMPIAYDVEDAFRSISLANLGINAVSKIIDAFCSTIRAAGYYPMIYGSEYATFNLVSKDIQKKYDLWVANWGSQPNLSWKMWQYAGDPQHQHVNGIPGSAVDMDKCVYDYPSYIMSHGLNGYEKGEKNSDHNKKEDARKNTLSGVSSTTNNSSAIFVGDSRTVGLYISINNAAGSTMDAIGETMKDGNIIVASVGKGLPWFKSNAIKEKIVSLGKGKTSSKIIIWLGFNDIHSSSSSLADIANSYVATATEIANSAGNDIYFISVGPRASKDDDNSDVKKFNEALKNAVNSGGKGGGRGPQDKSTAYWNRSRSSTSNKSKSSSSSSSTSTSSSDTKKTGKIKYIDLESWFLEQVKNGGIQPNGSDIIHYTVDSYKLIYDKILSSVGASGGSGRAKMGGRGLGLPQLAFNKNGGGFGSISSTSSPLSLVSGKGYSGKKNGGGFGHNISHNNGLIRYGGFGDKDESSSSSSGNANHEEHIKQLEAAVGQRLADFSSPAYTSENNLSGGQCTWYAEGRAYERSKWDGLHKQPMGNGGEVYANAKSKGMPTGSEPADDSLVSITNGSYGHVMYVEGVDNANNKIYYTEANNPVDNAISAEDGQLKVMSFSDWNNQSIAGYVYTDGSSSPISTNGSTTGNSSDSSSSSSTTGNTSSSVASGLEYVAAVLGEASSRMANAMFTGELDSDFSNFNVSSSSSSSSSSNTSTNTSTSTSGDSSGTSVSGDGVHEQVWNALIKNNFSNAATAGIMGNIEQESGFRPGVYSNDGGGGLVQWTPWQSKIGAYSIKKGKGELGWRDDVQMQMDYLNESLNELGDWESAAGISLADFKRSTDPEAAAIQFEKGYERPGIPRTENRTAAARKYYNQYAGGGNKNGGKGKGFGNGLGGLGGGSASLRNNKNSGKASTKSTSDKVNKYVDDILKQGKKKYKTGGRGPSMQNGMSIESQLLDGNLATDIYNRTNRVTNNVNTNNNQIDPAMMSKIIELLNSIVTNTYNTSNGINGLNTNNQNIINNNNTILNGGNESSGYKPNTSALSDVSRNTIIARRIAQGL